MACGSRNAADDAFAAEAQELLSQLPHSEVAYLLQPARGGGRGGQHRRERREAVDRVDRRAECPPPG